MAQNKDSEPEVITSLDDLYFDIDQYDEGDFVDYEFHGTGDTGGE